MLTKEIANNLSKELKIDLFTIYREHLQLLFLKYFYSQKETAQIFFKGETALRFLFDSFRFSEDLDFTSLVKKEALETIIKKALKDLEKEVGKISFRPEKTIEKAFTGRIFQELEEFKFPLTIKLDFSLRERPQRPNTSIIETVFPISPYPQVAHLEAEELLAEKIRAIFMRIRGRDLFDLWFLLSKKVPIDWCLVDQKMALYQEMENATLERLIERVKEISQEEIKADLTKFLPWNYRNLVDSIKNLVLQKLTSFR